MKNVKPVGLMTMAPFVDDPEEVRGIFRLLEGDSREGQQLNSALI